MRYSRLSLFLITLQLLLVVVFLPLPTSVHAAVLVIGATGRTGSLLYHELRAQPSLAVRALVRSVDKARAVLHCTACDETERIYVGDVRNQSSLWPALKGVHTVAIAAGVSGDFNHMTAQEIKDVEFVGVQNAVRALAQDFNVQTFDGLGHLRVVLCSSEGSTRFPSNNTFGQIIFQKLNAEAFLGSVGLTTAIVKPCGLTMDAGRNATLIASHDDAPTPTGSITIARADVARVMAQIVLHSPHGNLRFDLCSIAGPPTTDLDALIRSARWEWEQATTATSLAEEANVAVVNSGRLSPE